MLKLVLFFKIHKFYNTFGEVVGSNFITKLSDMTVDNLFDVMFDINEVVEGYDHEDTEDLEMLYAQIHEFRYHEFRKGTAPIYKLAQYLYKKGGIK
jgi:hypothetical protein